METAWGAPKMSQVLPGGLQGLAGICVTLLGTAGMDEILLGTPGIWVTLVGCRAGMSGPRPSLLTPLRLSPSGCCHSIPVLHKAPLHPLEHTLLLLRALQGGRGALPSSPAAWRVGPCSGP